MGRATKSRTTRITPFKADQTYKKLSDYKADDSYLHPVISRRNKSVNNSLGSSIYDVSMFDEVDNETDCERKNIAAKYEKVVSECKRATEDAHSLIEKMQQKDNEIVAIMKKLPGVETEWHRNPQKAQELLIQQYPTYNNKLQNIMNEIAQLRLQITTTVDPMFQKIHSIRSKVLKCYKNKCTNSDASKLKSSGIFRDFFPTTNSEECAFLYHHLKSIEGQLSECVVFNMRKGDVVNFFRNTKDMDEIHSNTNNSPLHQRAGRHIIDSVFGKNATLWPCSSSLGRSK